MSVLDRCPEYTGHSNLKPQVPTDLNSALFIQCEVLYKSDPRVLFIGFSQYSMAMKLGGYIEIKIFIL